MVNTHWIVGCDRPVYERKFLRVIRITLPVLARDLIVGPPVEDIILQSDEIHFGINRIEHFCLSFNEIFYFTQHHA